MSSYLPLLDELYCRTALFIKSWLESDSPIVSTVALYGIYYGRMNSRLGRTAFSAVPVMMSLISYLSLDTWSHSHTMLTHISPHSIEPQCCFYLSYCLSERCSQLSFIVGRWYWYVCWFYMQSCFMTVLLMRWQVIPANFVVFCNRSNFCHPSGSYATKSKEIIIISK